MCLGIPGIHGGSRYKLRGEADFALRFDGVKFRVAIRADSAYDLNGRKSARMGEGNGERTQTKG